jgi:hypothetical protein
MYEPNPTAPLDSLPVQNDRLDINYSIQCNAVNGNAILVIHNRPFNLDKIQSTEDGIILKDVTPDIIQNVSRVGGTDNFEIDFTVDDESR